MSIKGYFIFPPEAPYIEEIYVFGAIFFNVLGVGILGYSCGYSLGMWIGCLIIGVGSVLAVVSLVQLIHNLRKTKTKKTTSLVRRLVCLMKVALLLIFSMVGVLTSLLLLCLSFWVIRTLPNCHLGIFS